MLIFTMLVWEEVVGAVNTFGSDFLREMPQECATKLEFAKVLLGTTVFSNDNHWQWEARSVNPKKQGMFHTYPSGLFVSTIPSPVLTDSGAGRSNVALQALQTIQIQSKTNVDLPKCRDWDWKRLKAPANMSTASCRQVRSNSSSSYLIRPVHWGERMKKSDVESLLERPFSGTRKLIVSYEPRKWDPPWNDELRFVEKYGLHETKYFASESVGRWNCAVNWKLELSTPLPKAIPAGQPKQIAFHFPLYDPVARSERYRNMRFCGWTAVPYRLFLSLARQVTPIENSVLCASKEADALLGMGILKVAVCLKRTRKMNKMCEAQISGQTLQNFMRKCSMLQISWLWRQLDSHCWSWHLYWNLYKNIQFQRVPAQTANSMERYQYFSAVCLILHPFATTLTSDTLGDIPPRQTCKFCDRPPLDRK